MLHYSYRLVTMHPCNRCIHATRVTHPIISQANPASQESIPNWTSIYMQSPRPCPAQDLNPGYPTTFHIPGTRRNASICAGERTDGRKKQEQRTTTTITATTIEEQEGMWGGRKRHAVHCYQV